MEKIIIVDKMVGETPLEAMERTRTVTDIPMTYAGRLDPMAEGLLLVLTGDECKQKEKYLGLDKEYEVEILFGFSTDTYDLLGKMTEYSVKNLPENISLKKYIGKFEQPYPPYSSKPVEGKQLFAHAREGTLDEIEIPTRHTEIYSIDLIPSSYPNGITTKAFLKNIEEKIAHVKGDFRQKEILDIWRQHLGDSTSNHTCSMLKLKIRCSGGTYMRSLAYRIGEDLRIPSLAYSICRTRIGKYTRI